MSPEILNALAILASDAAHPNVWLLLEDGSRMRLSRQQAALRLLHGGYEVGCRKRRVRWIRVPGRPVKWQACWRNTKACMLWQWETEATS